MEPFDAASNPHPPATRRPQPPPSSPQGAYGGSIPPHEPAPGRPDDAPATSGGAATRPAARARRLPKRLLQDPLLLLILYGLTGLAAGLVHSPDPALATRWALYFLAVPVLGRVLLVGRDREAAARRARLAWNVLEGLAVGISLVILGLAFWKLGLWGMLASGKLEFLGFTTFFHDAYGLDYFSRNEVAVFAAAASTMMLTRFLHATTRRHALPWASLLAPCLLLLVVTQSPIPLVIFLAVLPVVFLLEPRRSPARVAAGALAALGSLAGLWIGLQQYVTAYEKRGIPILRIFTTVDHRTGLWLDAWHTFLQHPLLGWGFAAGMLLVGDLHDYPYVIHDAWLHAAIVGGIPGLAFFTLSFASAWWLLLDPKRGRRRVRGPGDDEGAQGAEARVILAQAIPILLFVTLRTIPEDTAAMLNIPLVALVGVMVVGMGGRTANARATFGMAVADEHRRAHRENADWVNESGDEGASTFNP